MWHSAFEMELPYPRTTIGCIKVPAIRLAIPNNSTGLVKTFTKLAPEKSAN